MLTEIVVNIALLVILASLYVRPHRENRLERLFVATVGALVGSLVGRIWVNPPSTGHLAFLLGGASLFAAIDWIRKSHRPTNS